ncbi:MAG: TetR family transcriptional regulator [Candidatus Dormibacteraceae bacterium]
MNSPAIGRREQRKQQLRRTIQEHALRLFVADGYEVTTVERIAAAAGISHMTFFRYFPTKESVVETDDFDPLITQLIRDRPDAEDPLAAIQQGLVTMLRSMPDAELQTLLIRTRLAVSTPALRARMWENQYATQELFTAALAEREPTASSDNPDKDPSRLRLRVLAGVALATLTTALIIWVENSENATLPDLIDKAFAALSS